MTNKQRFIDYVKHGGSKPVCSVQIGAGAGYDTKMAGKEWITETTLEDTIKVCETYDMLPLYNLGVDILLPSGLSWKPVFEEITAASRKWSYEIPTPYGALKQTVVELKHKGVTRIADPVNGEEDLDKFEWLLDKILEGDFSRVTEAAAPTAAFIGGRGAVDFQWGMQPYELFSYPNTLNTMYLAMDCGERFLKLMDKCLAISEKIVGCISEAKGDFCFLGGPAAEMVNPYIYEKFMVPYGKKISGAAHKAGLLIYSHVCSPVEPFLTKGYFNQLGIDLFETLSMKPVGNVISIEDAFGKIDANICTRGNIGLDRLMNGTPGEIIADVNHIMDMAVKFKRKHLVAASDYLMTECKPENIKAICDAVKNYKIN